MVTAQHEKNILIFPIQTQKISHINNRGTQKELSSSPKQGIDSYEQPKNRGYFQQRSDFMQLNPEISMPYHGADLMTCDPGKLVDLKDVHIDTSLPVRERMRGFVQQVGNPYLFKVNGLIVKATYLPQANRRLADSLPGLLIP